MSFSKYASPLVLEVLPSIALGAVLLCAHVGAAVVLAFLPIPFWIILAAMLLLGAHALYVLRLHALLRDRTAIVRMVWDAQERWTLTCRDGSSLDARLSPSSYVHPALTVLNFKTSRWRGRSVVIVPSRVDAERFRQLRVRLMLTRSSAA